MLHNQLSSLEFQISSMHQSEDSEITGNYRASALDLIELTQGIADV